MSKNIEGVGEVATPSTPKEKIQNFWYHYKWHSAVAIVVIIAVLVCSLQLCGRTKYDAYILYAGPKNIGRTTQDGNFAEIETVISSLRSVTGDYDNSGEVSVNFTNYYFLTNEEAEEAGDFNDSLLMNDQKALSSVLEHSEYYLMFISIGVYEQYHKVGDGEMFIDLTGYAGYNPDVRYYAPNAIYLSSIDASKLPGIANLPEDTLICIRETSVMAGKSKEHLEHLQNAKNILINLLMVDTFED